MFTELGERIFCAARVVFLLSILFIPGCSLLEFESPLKFGNLAAAGSSRLLSLCPGGSSVTDVNMFRMSLERRAFVRRSL